MSSDDIFGDRRKALEEEFFRKENEKLLQRLRERRAREEAIQALAEASGFEEHEILEALHDAGIAVETFAALSLVPLVLVAWADGEIQESECEAILRAAAAEGLAPGCAARGLLEGWLAEPPPRALEEAWEAYVRSLVERLEEQEAARLAERVLGRARRVAEAAGGFLGLTLKVSSEEQAVLERLERAFRRPGTK